MTIDRFLQLEREVARAHALRVTWDDDRFDVQVQPTAESGWRVYSAWTDHPRRTMREAFASWRDVRAVVLCERTDSHQHWKTTTDERTALQLFAASTMPLHEIAYGQDE